MNDGNRCSVADILNEQAFEGCLREKIGISIDNREGSAVLKMVTS